MIERTHFFSITFESLRALLTVAKMFSRPKLLSSVFTSSVRFDRKQLFIDCGKRTWTTSSVTPFLTHRSPPIRESVIYAARESRCAFFRVSFNDCAKRVAAKRLHN